MHTLGRHLLLDLRDCNDEALDNLDLLQGVLASVIEEAGIPVLEQSFHRFQPQGVSGLVMGSGSHLCIHTWPEHGYAAIDIFTHSDLFQPEEAAKTIIERLEAKNPSLVELKRGF